MSGTTPGGSGASGDTDATRTGIHAHADFAPGSVLGERYRIEAILGIGGMGVVYRATDLALGVPVALKLLRAELAHRADAFERFRQELLLARQVSSPRVVRIHDLAQHDGHWLISMDLIDGPSLDHVLDRGGLDGQAGLPLEQALRITRQVAEGLVAAHARDVVHRDLKPANILLDGDGNAAIADFGVARSLATSGQTRTGSMVGTPDYISPEQARGEPADARSDLYALGLMLYEMLAGKPPFAGGTMAETLAQRMLQSPPPVTRARPDTPPWVARLVDRLLRSQPAHRLQTAQAVIDAIDRREVPRPSFADQLRAPRTRWIAVAVAVLAALSAFGWWQWSQRQVAVVASPPLQRLLVLPIAGAASPDLATAWSARLRDALGAVPGHAVVDRDRSLQALRQLDPDGSNPPALDKLRASAGASRVLQPALVRVGDGWRLHAVLADASSQSPLPGPVAADPVAAIRAWSTQAGIVRALGYPAGALATALPDKADAVAAYGAGLRARSDGDLATALAKLAETTRLAPDDARAWLDEAETALMVGNQDQAADALEQGQRADAHAPALQARLAAQRALVEGDAPAAIAQWRKLLAATPDDTEAELQLARARGAGGDFPAAVAALQALTRRDGNDPRAWYELGKFSILSGNAQRAVDDYLVRALVQFKRSRDRYGQAETVNALGIGYGRLGQSADAAEQYRKAVELRHAIGNIRGEATSLRNLGNALSLTGNYDAAAADLDRARVLHTQLGDRAGLAAVENEIGLLAEERGNYPQALDAFRHALKSWQAVDDPFGIAQAQNDIGFAQFQLGNYNDAQVYLQQAAADADKLGDATGQVRAAQDLALLDIARGRWAQARTRLGSSLRQAQSQQMQEEAAVSRRHLAELELRQGHVEAAIAQAQAARASFVQREDPRGASDAGLIGVEALLAAHADGRARDALQALAPSLKQSPSEQRSIAQLLQAELSARSGDRAAATRALHAARELAASSGIVQLQLRIALVAARLAGTDVASLDAATANLGNVGLRLQWLQLAMQQALARHDTRQALAQYDEANALLRNGNVLEAASLHALGAQARQAGGDDAGARAAQARADDASRALRAALPKTLLAGFDAGNRP